MGVFVCQVCLYGYDSLEHSDKCGSALLSKRKFNIGDVVRKGDVRYKVTEIRGPFPPPELISVADEPTTDIDGCVAVRHPLDLIMLSIDGPLPQGDSHFYVYGVVAIESGVSSDFLEEDLELTE